MAEKQQTPVVEMSFEKALEELEKIVGSLERGDVALADSIDLYARGDELRKHCDKLLSEAEARVEKIRIGGGGRPAGLEPLDGAK
jgi:exodeoxyribonuclease VII small subunit